MAGAKGRSGGFRPEAGRPKGTKNIFSRDSVKKLEELEFDPIEKMISKYYEVEAILNGSEFKRGSIFHGNCLSLQQKIVNDLMAYGYKKIPEKQEIENTQKKPISVVLTSAKSKEVEE